MPAAIPLVVAAASAAAELTVLGLTIAQTAAFLSGVASVAVGFLQQSLAGKPDGSRAQPFTVEARDRTQVVRSPIAPRRVVYGTTLVAGPLVYATSTGSSKEYLHLVTPLAGHEVTAINDVYFNDTLATDARFSGRYRINKHLGAADQVADSDLVAEVSEWTANHRLRGVAYIYVRLQWNSDTWPTGIPNINAVVQGRKVYDPRTGQTVFSNNPALCLRDYLVQSFGLAASTDEIDDASFIAAANVCDEDVPLAGGGSQKRYTLDGAFNLDAKPIDVIEDMLTSCAGVLVYSQGRYRLTAGAAGVATVTLSDDDLRAPIKVRPRMSRRELYNAVRGTFVDPQKSWQPADFPPVVNALYQAQDGSQQIYRDIELPYTTDNVRAQRIAKIHLEMSRQGITVEFPAKLGALQIAVWDVVNLTSLRFGWTNKPFRVLSWTLAEDAGVDLVLQEYSSAAYDWNSGEATTYDPAPDTNLPRPWVVAQPIALAAAEDLYATRDGSGVKAKAILSWQAASDAFVEQYQLEYKLKVATEYLVAGRTTQTTLEILDIAPGIYDFRVKALNGLGVSSAYTTLQREIFGLGAPPSPVTGLSIAAISSVAILSWTAHPDLDVRVGGFIRVRHSPVSIGATWQSATDIGPAVSGTSTNVALPLVAGTYLVKAYDSSGVASLTAASVNTNAPSLLEFANIDTLNEHPLFLGTKTNCVVSGSTLRLGGSGPFDTIADVDGLPDLDAFGGVALSGTYAFAGAIDLGTEQTVRLGGRVQSLVVNTLDKLDSRSASVDEWDDFDGTAAASADCRIFVRETDDDPSGSPVWGAWQALTIGDHRARAFQFKAELTTNDPAYNIVVSELSVTADEVI